MIRKLTDQWGEIEKGIRPMERSNTGESGSARARHTDTKQLQAIVSQIGNVRDALRTMCKVSVTRQSLKSAVREALFPVIQEHRDELFPEVVELRRRLGLAEEDPGVLDVYRGESPTASDEAVKAFRERLEGFEARIGELGSSFNEDLEGVGSKVDTVETGLTRLRSSVDHQVGAFQDSLEQVQGAVSKVQQHLGQLEESVPEQAKAAADEVEERLRKEIAEMVEQLDGKLADLRDVLGRVESTVPTREQLSAVGERLERLEVSFDRVSEQVTTIESSTPEVQALGQRFQELRELVGSTSERLEASGELVGSAISTTLGTRIDELESALRDGIRRWESDQSQVSERLGNLRDSLRDQLREFSSQVEDAHGSLWGKLTGKKDPGLKLSGEEFDALSDKLEGVIAGIETVIAKRKDDQSGSAASESESSNASTPSDPGEPTGVSHSS